MNQPTPQVDGYLRKNKRWLAELSALRAMLLQSRLDEEVKWMSPCYTLDGANVAMLGAFKECCVISFMKGSLINDPLGLLVKPGANTQAARVIRFTDVESITRAAEAIKDYIEQAIRIEQAGLKPVMKKANEFDIPAEFQTRLASNPELHAAFEALTPGRRRAYLLHFAGAKQSTTRSARIDKWTPQILAGKGMAD